MSGIPRFLIIATQVAHALENESAKARLETLRRCHLNCPLIASSSSSKTFVKTIDDSGYDVELIYKKKAADLGCGKSGLEGKLRLEKFEYKVVAYDTKGFGAVSRIHESERKEKA